MSDANTSGDSKELEDLFDSIAAGAPPAAPAAPAPVKASLMQQLREVEGEVDDSDELQALFEAVVAAQRTDAAAPAADAPEPGPAGRSEEHTS